MPKGADTQALLRNPPLPDCTPCSWQSVKARLLLWVLNQPSSTLPTSAVHTALLSCWFSSPTICFTGPTLHTYWLPLISPVSTQVPYKDFRVRIFPLRPPPKQKTPNSLPPQPWSPGPYKGKEREAHTGWSSSRALRTHLRQGGCVTRAARAPHLIGISAFCV